MFKRTLLLLVTLLSCVLTYAQQGFRYNCTKDTTVAACGLPCATITTTIPDIRGQSNTYTVNKVASSSLGCFAPYVAPNNNFGSPTQLVKDDWFTNPIPLGFTFTFFGDNYTQFLAGSNGEVCFDLTQANSNSGYQLPFNLPNAYYPKAIIMGPRHDIDLEFANTSPNKKVQYQVIGQEPHRKWILSFYKVPLYLSSCWPMIENTHQIVLYEGTGIVEVFLLSVQSCSFWNSGRAMVGMQDDSRTLGIMAPGRAALDPPWGTPNMNEVWRFVPSQGISLLKRIEVVNLSTNTLEATYPPSAATSLGNGLLQISLPNLCAPSGTTSYLVRPVYQRVDKQIFMGNPALTGTLYETQGADTIRITRPTGVLNISATATNAECNVGGTVTVTATPAGNYRYKLDSGPFQLSNVFNNVPAGPHTVSVTESTGSCLTTTNVQVNPANPLNATASNGTTACPGTATGSITVTAVTGTAPFEYRIGTGPWQTSNVFSGLAVGSYTFYTKDALGCTSNPATGNVTDGPGPTATATGTATSCLGASDGTVTVTVSSGGGPFEYSMNPTGPWQASNIFSGLAVGSYNFYAKAGTCVSSAVTGSVTAGPQIAATASATATSCQGAADGSVTITATSGTGPFEYAMTSTGPWQTSAVFSGLPANSYNFYMRNAAGCISAAIPATVNPGPALQIAATGSPTSCAGASDGSVTVSNPNGTGPFEYRLGATGSWQTSPTFSNLAVGSYDVYTRNAAGCVSPSTQASVQAGSVLQASVTTTPTSCAGANNGSAQVNALSGSGPYEYRMGAAGVWQSSNTFTGLAPGSYSFYVRAPSGCISNAVPGDITDGPAVTAQPVASATSCAGASDGSVTVTAPTGTGPFEFSMSATGPWQTSGMFSGLAQGSYMFYARNAQCVSAGVQATVNPGPALVASASATSTSCAGAADGSVVVTNTNGTGPFEYSLSATGPWQTSATFNGLAQGSYTAYTRNAACTSSGVTVSVGNGAELQANTAASNTSCAGANDGVVTVSAANGTGPFEYRLGASGIWQSSNSFTGLAPGTYDFYVRNTAGCISPAKPGTVNAGSALQASATATPTSCEGAADGTVVVSNINGAGPFEYSMNAAGPWQTSNTFTGLAQGQYTFYIRNTICVSAGVQATVSPGAVLQASATSTATSCAGASDGTITITPLNGNGAFTFSLNAAGPWQSSATFTGLAQGSYMAYFRNNDCASSGVPVSVSAGAELQANVNAVNTSCAGATDGSVTVSAANGTGPFEYRMDAGTWQSSGNFTGLATGTYNFYVRNAAGCISPAKPGTINSGSALQASATSTPASCSGATNGSVTVTAITGTPPFEYRMGATGAWQTSNTFSGLAQGSYTFYTRTGSCMSDPVQVNVGSNFAPTATFTKTDVTCFGGTDGTAVINPTATGMAYTFSADNFATEQTSNVFNNLAANNYTFWFKDNAGCIGTVNVVVGQPAQLSSTTPAVTPARCNGSSDGSISLSGTGGTSPYQYSINGGAFGNSNTFNVSAGSYDVMIRDANGCTYAVNNIAVSESAPVSLTVTQTTNASCNGGADGLIQLNATGGKSPYRYLVTGYALQTSPTFNVNPGSYTVSVTDNNNCTYTLPAPVTVGLTNDLAYTPMNDITVCEGASAVLQPQTNATQFTWQGPAITPNSTNGSAVTVRPVNDTMYTVAAVFGRCSTTDTVNVYVTPAPVADAGIGDTICFGNSDTLSASGGVTYEWSPATYLTGNLTGPDPVVLNPQKTITYTLYVRDAANCRSLSPATVTVTVTPPLVVIVNPIDTIGYFGDSIRVRAFAAGAVTYNWTPVTGIRNPDSASLVVYVTTDRIYKVTAVTAAGCSGEGSFKLRAYKGPDIYVPTAFTPNGDGLNDRVRPFSVGIEKLNYFRVFDRWGQVMYEYKGEKRGPVVYHMLQSNIGWDGNFKGVQLNTGTFVWVAEGLTKEGKKVFKKGSVTLIR